MNRYFQDNKPLPKKANEEQNKEKVFVSPLEKRQPNKKDNKVKDKYYF